MNTKQLWSPTEFYFQNKSIFFHLGSILCIDGEKPVCLLPQPWLIWMSASQSEIHFMRCIWLAGRREVAYIKCMCVILTSWMHMNVNNAQGQPGLHPHKTQYNNKQTNTTIHRSDCQVWLSIFAKVYHAVSYDYSYMVWLHWKYFKLSKRKLENIGQV